MSNESKRFELGTGMNSARGVVWVAEQDDASATRILHSRDRVCDEVNIETARRGERRFHNFAVSVGDVGEEWGRRPVR